MNLYTILFTYEDYTTSIDQYKASSPKEAFEFFLKKSEALKEYDREKLLDIFHTKKEDNLLLAYHGIRNARIVNFGTPATGYRPEIAIFGGCIVQTHQSI